MHRTLRRWILANLCGDIKLKCYYQNILITKINFFFFSILQDNVEGIWRVSNIKSWEQRLVEFTFKQFNSMNVYIFMLVFFVGLLKELLKLVLWVLKVFF